MIPTPLPAAAFPIRRWFWIGLAVLLLGNIAAAILGIRELRRLSQRVEEPVLWLGEESFSPPDIQKKLRENPLGPEEPLRVLELGRNRRASLHLIQVRDRERPHRHARHDLVARLVQGEGDLYLQKPSSGYRRISLKRGDLIHVPAGSGHYFVNRAGAPSVAVAWFLPPFDGKDVVEIR